MFDGWGGGRAVLMVKFAEIKSCFLGKCLSNEGKTTLGNLRGGKGQKTGNPSQCGMIG